MLQVSGSFNPLHAGHLLMARAAQARERARLSSVHEAVLVGFGGFTGAPLSQAHAAARVHGGGSPPHVVFEMSVGNPDKPPLPAEARDRVLGGDIRVVACSFWWRLQRGDTSHAGDPATRVAVCVHRPLRCGHTGVAIRVKGDDGFASRALVSG